jgi:xylulokinase
MSMTAAWLTDNRRLDVLAYDEKLVRRSGVAAAKLPPLVPSGSVVGTVQATVAAELGIPTDVQVVTGLPDLHGATVGSGCVLEGQQHLSIGTSAWVSCPLPVKRTDILRQQAAVPGLGTHSAPYLLANNQDSAGRCLQWFRDNVAALAGPVPSYDEITALAATSAPGAGGVLFTPWLTGERSPVDDRSARAGFHHVSVATTGADLARAVLEGVALNLRWLLEASERFAGRRLDPLRMVGGGARSDLWCQVVADVCDRRIERVTDPLVSGLRGAGLYAGLVVGDVAPEEVRTLVPVDACFRPDPRRRTTYDLLFDQLPRVYRAQRGLFRKLQRLES